MTETGLHIPSQSRGLQLPRRQRHYGFSMTAMADMLFQLLIFFMLSANLTAFSMLNIRTGALAGSNPATGPQPGAVTSGISTASTTAVWTLGRDGLIAGGQRFALEQLGVLAQALADQGTTNVLIVLRPDVPVEDVIAVLEVLHARGIDAVQLADGGAR